MKNWQDEFLATWETTVKEFEKISQDLTQLVENVGEEIVETVDYIAEQIDSYIPPEVEEFLDELFQPFLDFEESWRGDYWENQEYDDYLSDFSDFSLNPKVEPSSELYPACRGCRHYHGRIYNDHLLVCGMHPYGWDDQNCPDWEKQDE